jgi:hypothetical protein
MEVAVTMPSSTNILERLRWKIGLGLVVVAAGFAAQAAPSGAPTSEVARSSWGFISNLSAERESLAVPAAAESTDVARSSWGFMADRNEARLSLDVSADLSDVA